MSQNSSIEWTEATWNPITGCSKISEGCKNCYAERMAKRLQAMGAENYRNGFQVTLHNHILKYPLNWKKPQMIFVNSMSDLFHETVPTSFIIDIFKIIQESKWHTFQILTKRASRLKEMDKFIQWPDNIWLGVSVENSNNLERIKYLQNTKAKIKFISFEPLLGQIKKTKLRNINWVIVGGESGPFSRPMYLEWVTIIRDQCLSDGIPFFFKQWGGKNRKKTGRLLEGKIWDEYPSDYKEFIKRVV
jgi:protein gp37